MRKVIHMVPYLSVVELIMGLRKMHLFLGKIICIIWWEIQLFNISQCTKNCSFPFRFYFVISPNAEKYGPEKFRIRTLLQSEILLFNISQCTKNCSFPFRFYFVISPNAEKYGPEKFRIRTLLQSEILNGNPHFLCSELYSLSQ